MKKISIITVNKNNDKGLLTTAKSILSQTALTDIEWIVIDGGSTDESCSVIRQYEQHIDYWVSEIDGGIYNGMNKGINKAHGEYVLFMNSGDQIHDERVIENFLCHPTYGQYDYYSGITKLISQGRKIFPPSAMTLEAFYRWSLPHQSTFIKRSRFKEHLYDESMKIAADLVFAFADIMVRNAGYTTLPFIVAIYDTTGVSSRPENVKLAISERDKGFRECIPQGLYKDIHNLLGRSSGTQRRVIRHAWNNTWEFKLLCSISKALSIPRKIKEYLTNSIKL